MKYSLAKIIGCLPLYLIFSRCMTSPLSEKNIVDDIP